MANPLLERLRPLGRERWREPGPGTEAQLAAVEARVGLSLPSDYRALLIESGGGWLYGFTTRLELFPLEDLDWKCVEEHLTCADVPGGITIGTDGSDSVFFYDARGVLGRGAWALFMVELGILKGAEAKFVGRNLGELVDAILSDESLWSRPTLAESAATSA
ncbi:MAG: SMI1/KNR4 family protein [Polyangiaceae bacterium]